MQVDAPISRIDLPFDETPTFERIAAGVSGILRR
jgi:hypothetical protein